MAVQLSSKIINRQLPIYILLMSEADIQNLLNVVLNEEQPIIHVADEVKKQNDDAVGKKEEVDLLKDQNGVLKNALNNMDKEVANRDIIIEGLKKKLKESEEKVTAQEKRLQTEQAKIDKLTIQLQKVQKLLEKLLNKHGSKHHSKLHSFTTPQIDKAKITLDFSKINENQQFKYSDNINMGSFRSSKTQNYSDSIKKSPIIQSNSFRARLQLSPSSGSFGGNYQTDEYKRYRREKLMASQNINDVLKIQKFLSKRP